MALTNAGRGALLSAIDFSSDFSSAMTNGQLVTSSTTKTNPNINGQAGLFPLEADIVLIANTFTPTATGSIQALLLPSDDGTNYETPYVANGTQLTPISALLGQATTYAITYATGTLFRIRVGWFSGSPFKIAIFNNTGVSVTLTAVKIYPFGDAAA